MAQSCIELAGSTMCPAFNASSISTSAGLIAQLYGPNSRIRGLLA
jgi:hypothetical protein